MTARWSFGLNLAPDQICAILGGHRGDPRAHHPQQGDPGMSRA
jgi:hypothetical protein